MHFLSTVLASALLVFGLLYYGAQADYPLMRAKELREKYTAELRAAELLEVFRGLTSQQLYQHLGTLPAYPLCAHINILDRSTNTILNPDPLASLSEPLFGIEDGQIEGPNRFYQVQVVDITQGLEPDPNRCGDNPGTTVLNPNERLLVLVGVTYFSTRSNPKRLERVVLSTLLPI